jgi:hypothetical protein
MGGFSTWLYYLFIKIFVYCIITVQIANKVGCKQRNCHRDVVTSCSRADEYPGSWETGRIRLQDLIVYIGKLSRCWSLRPAEGDKGKEPRWPHLNKQRHDNSTVYKSETILINWTETVTKHLNLFSKRHISLESMPCMECLQSACKQNIRDRR